MISKEQFVKIINRLKEADETVNKVNNILKNTSDSIENDFMNASAMSISHESLVVELLQDIFNDKLNITYWLYELDYGRKYYDGCVQETNGSIIDISTPEKLYDILIKEMEEQNAK